MFAEVTGTNVVNKGAELMLLAIKQHVERSHRDIRLVVDQSFGTYENKAAYGLWQKLYTERLGRSKLIMQSMPRVFRRAYGMVLESEIDVVLDASGFAFSEQNPLERTEGMATAVKRWKKQGKRIVFLPQAFGPFKSDRIRRAFSEILENSDLVYAREQASFEHAVELSRGAGNVRQAPDFTNLLSGRLPEHFVPQPRQACIVPNHRMLEKTDAEISDRYVPFLADCIRECVRHDLDPYVLLHSPMDDSVLVDPLFECLGHRITVVTEVDPLAIKGILGTAHLVIASRFHALISALSQGVPCLGTGWSHKYQMLFDTYKCSDLLLSPKASREELSEAVSRASDGESRDVLLKSLKEVASEQVRAVEEMWQSVDSTVFNHH